MSTPKNLPWEPAKIGTKSFIEDIYYDEVDAYEMEDIIESLENPLDTRHTVWYNKCIKRGLIRELPLKSKISLWGSCPNMHSGEEVAPLTYTTLGVEDTL
jgi:hypothetical protein